MKKTVEEHADRFDGIAAEYDEHQHSEEYRAAASLVTEYAAPKADDTVLDLGTGTGAIALALASDTTRVLGRDISGGMMDEARTKAAEAGIENIEFGEGSFREPVVSEPVDVVVSNFAMHHLGDDEKREAIEAIAKLGPRKFVLGDVMLFGEPNPEEPFYSPEVDDPATVGMLADALTDVGFSLTAVESVGPKAQRGADGETVEVGHEQVGVLVAERASAGKPE